MLSVKTILVPVDFSGSSDRALEYAMDLADRLDARVTLVNTYEYPIYALPEGLMLPTLEVESSVAKAARSALDAAVEKCRARGADVGGVLRSGRPWEEINHVAAEIGADLIVMGTHGRSGLAHAFFGSVAEKTMRGASCPVLVIREATARSREVS
jgi:universal stress protein A